MILAIAEDSNSVAVPQRINALERLVEAALKRLMITNAIMKWLKSHCDVRLLYEKCDSELDDKKCND